MVTTTVFALLSGAELKIVQDYQLRYPTNHPSSALVQASGKMVLIDKLLIKLKESGHKVGGCGFIIELVGGMVLIHSCGINF